MGSKVGTDRVAYSNTPHDLTHMLLIWLIWLIHASPYPVMQQVPVTTMLINGIVYSLSHKWASMLYHWLELYWDTRYPKKWYDEFVVFVPDIYLLEEIVVNETVHQPQTIKYVFWYDTSTITHFPEEHSAI